jgi:arylsulfatase A-like enzyme
MLDYAFEVEHFDTHLGRMLASLERRGLLENTLVVVTSDHGMPFPRGKGGAYEYSNHVPLAMMWPKGIVGKGRLATDFVSFIDFAPTFLEYAGIPGDRSGLAEPSGRSLGNIFRSAKSGRIQAQRDHVLIGMERHDIGRPKDVGYPIRGIVNDQYLYLKNYEPSRWPACNPETGYLNVDGGATKTWILSEHRKNPLDPFWALCFGKRPSEELYDLKNDPDCVVNLARSDALKETCEKLSGQMVSELKDQGDPRILGKGDIFDQYPHANKAMFTFMSAT